MTQAEILILVKERDDLVDLAIRLLHFALDRSEDNPKPGQHIWDTIDLLKEKINEADKTIKVISADL